LGACF